MALILRLLEKGLREGGGSFGGGQRRMARKRELAAHHERDTRERNRDRSEVLPPFKNQEHRVLVKMSDRRQGT